MSRGKRKKQLQRGNQPAPIPQQGAPAPFSVPGQMISAQVRESYQGPIPPPQLLEQYDQLVPGAAKQILGWAEQQTQHRHGLENRVVGSDIQRSYWGLAAGFVVAMTAIVAGSWLVGIGHDTAGATIATASVVALVSVFIYGTSSRRQEREEKSKLMRGQK